MKTQFTKGEWRISYPIEKGVNFIIHESGIDICEIKSQDYLTAEQSLIEEEANAKLIAAAPDLLKKLQGMLNLFDKNLPEESIGRIYCDEVIKTIKKATE